MAARVGPPGGAASTWFTPFASKRGKKISPNLGQNIGPEWADLAQLLNIPLLGRQTLGLRNLSQLGTEKETGSARSPGDAPSLPKWTLGVRGTPSGGVIPYPPPSRRAAAVKARPGTGRLAGGRKRHPALTADGRRDSLRWRDNTLPLRPSHMAPPGVLRRRDVPVNGVRHLLSHVLDCR